MEKSKVVRKNPDAIKKYIRKVEELPTVAIGFPASKAGTIEYPDGTSLIDVATWNNYGTDTIPARRFMDVGGHRAIRETDKIRKAVIRAMASNPDLVDNLIEQTGAVGASQIKLTIRDWQDPPNASSTIARKGDNNPLVDTGLMMQSVTWEVRPKKKEDK